MFLEGHGFFGFLLVEPKKDTGILTGQVAFGKLNGLTRGAHFDTILFGIKEGKAFSRSTVKTRRQQGVVRLGYLKLGWKLGK